jgi:eukaryotic-like serine/threonine-protein kinase
MKRIVASLLLLVVLALGTPALAADGFFRLLYPSDWRPIPADAFGVKAAFLIPTKKPVDVFDENINLVIHDLKQKLSLNEYTAGAMNKISSVPSIKILESNDFELSGERAHRVVFTGQLGNLPMKWLQVWALHENKAFVITYSAEAADYDACVSDVEKFIRLFQFVNPA